MKKAWEGYLEKIDDFRWRIPMNYMEGMRVPGLIYADENLLEHIRLDQTPQQVANAACLPGIVKYSLCMPDIHWGYGLPIGGVVATKFPSGVISPGGVGSDINCGVRLLKTELELKEVKEKLEELLQLLFQNIPSGIGSKGYLKLSQKEIEELVIEGAKWLVQKGFGWEEDIFLTEEKGHLKGADPMKVSNYAYQRGFNQIGTLGSGNHFLEIQVVEEIYDKKIADIFGIFKDQITIMIHSGSRGFGYQICEDYIKKMNSTIEKFKIFLPDRQLVCAPLDSKEGKDYFAAMACAANYAWANRQCLMHETRKTFEKIFKKNSFDLGMHLVYDVAHNIAKIEEHEINNNKEILCVHRKGATRCFPSYHSNLPEKYKLTGQPVIIPGDMGRNSFLLVGTPLAMEETFGSTCHGAGRILSRISAKKKIKSKELLKELKEKGILVKTKNNSSLAEEASLAYKNIDQVVEVVHQAGISKKIAKMRPLGVIKG